MVTLLFFHFRITNSNLKNINLHFELLTQSRLLLEIQFYLCPVLLEGPQKKKKSRLNLLVTKKPGTQN